MGNLTDDMTRLRGEINTLRSNRGVLMFDLAQNVKSIKSTVASLLSDFSSSHADMAINSKKSRVAFVSGVKEMVAGMKDDMQNDLAGARKAWCRATPAPKKAPIVVERRQQIEDKLRKEEQNKALELKKMQEEQRRKATEKTKLDNEKKLAAAKAQEETKKRKDEAAKKDLEAKKAAQDRERIAMEIMKEREARIKAAANEAKKAVEAAIEKNAEQQKPVTKEIKKPLSIAKKPAKKGIKK
jgi:hypothetical protein